MLSEPTIFSTPLVYDDVCFTLPFWEFEPSLSNEYNENYSILFINGVLKPRVKKLVFHSGLEYDIPDKSEDCYLESGC